MDINWPSLVEQGRAKAYGVPWNDEELAAIHTLGIPPEYVRGGCLTVEDYGKASRPSGGKKQDRFMKLDDFRKEADALGVAYGKDTTRAELLEMVRDAREASKPSGNPLTPPEAAGRKS